MEEIMEDIIRCIAKNNSSEDELFECVKKGAADTQYGLNRYILNKSIEDLIEDGYIKRVDDQYILEDKGKEFLRSNED
jgi:predicted transcriptional regulator